MFHYVSISVYDKSQNIHISLIIRKQSAVNTQLIQRLYIQYIDSILSVLSKFSSFKHLTISVAGQPVLCQPWSETPKAGFLMPLLIYLKAKFEQYDLRNVHKLIGL